MSRILITVDHKWRDLPGAVYAGILLEKKGHKVKYVRHGLERFYIQSFKPDLIVLIHLYDKVKQNFAKKMSNAGIKIVLMPTEGIPTLEKYRRFASGARCDFSGVDLNFVWNETMANYIGENSTIIPSKTHVIGVPRFDFYQKPLSSTLKTKKEFCRDQNFNSDFTIITFATNFTQAVFHTKLKNFLINDAETLGYKDIMDEMHGGPENIAKMDYESRAILMEAFIRLVKVKKHVNFILKLHPSEDHQYYKNVINSQLGDDGNRVALITTGFIWDVLNVSDILLKRSCTTGVEAWLLGKPTIEMKINPDEWYYSEEHASGSNVVSTYDEMEKLVDEYLSGKSIGNDLAKTREKFITKWCFKHDGKSTQRMVNYIDALTENNLQAVTIPRQGIKVRLVHLLLGIGDYFVHDLRVYGFKNTIKKTYVDKLGREDKFIHKKDIETWEKKLKKIMN